MRLIPTRLAPKLNLSLFVFMLVLGGAVAALVFFGFNRTQKNATSQSRQGLEQQGRDLLLGSAELNARIGQSQFAATSGIGREAAHYMTDVKERGGTIPWDSSRLTATSDGQLYDPTIDRRTDVRVPAGLPDAVAERDLADSAPLDALFPTLLANFGAAPGDGSFGPVSVYFRSVNNVVRQYPAIGGGARPLTTEGEPVIPDGLDAQSNPERRSVWGAPHPGLGTPGQVITSYTPVYEGDEFRGVIGVDLSLQRLIEQINDIRPSPKGFAFYIGADGSVLRSEGFSRIDTALSGGNSDEGLGRAIDAMRRGESSVDRVQLDGEDVFIGYAPMSDIGGSLALVAPLSDVTAQAAAVDHAIATEGNQTLAFTLATMAGFLVAALAGGAWMYQRMLLSPISGLVRGTHAVTEGDVTTRIPVQSTDELGMLADSFNRMTQQIEQRRMALRDEIAERERTAEALREREAQYRSVFESTTDGLIIAELGGRVAEVNPAACAMHGYTREEFLQLPPRAHIAPEFHPLRQQMLDQVTSGGEFRTRSRNVRKDGSTFPTEVLGTIMTYRGKPHVLAVVRDITEQVEAERVLEQRVRDRTNEIATLLEITGNIGSTLELRPLLDTILEQVKRVVNYDLATFLLVEGREVNVHAVNTVHPDDIETLMRVRMPVNESDLLWQALSRGEAVNLGNLVEDTPIARATREGMRGRVGPTATRVRSWLGVPLQSKGRLIGMLAITSEQHNFFSENDVQLALAVAGQAAFAVENARLFQQTQERTQEFATLLEVARSVSSSLHVGTLARLILEQAGAVIGYDRAVFAVVEGDDARVVDVHDMRGTPDLSLLSQRGMRLSLTEPEAIAEPLARGEPVVIDDVREPGTLSDAWENLGERWDRFMSPVRSWMTVPLMSQGRLVGFIGMSKTVPSFFTPHHVELAEAIASQAAVGLENARLFEQAQQRTQELGTLLDVAAHVGSTLELRPLAHRILEETAVVIGYDRSTFALAEDGMLEVVGVHAAHGPADPGLLEQIGERYPVGGQAMVWDELLAGRPVIVEDTHDDSALSQAYRAAVGPRHVARSQGRSWMAVPLMLQGKLSGLMLMTKRAPRFFTQRHADLALAIASQAAVGIENARLYEQTQQRTRELGTVLEVSHAVASTLQLQELFALILDQLENVTQFTGASLLVKDADDLVIVESRGQGRREDEAIGMRFPTELPGSWWSIISQDGSLLIDDVRSDSPYGAMYREALGEYLELPAFSYVRSWLGVALLHQGKVVGMLSMSHAKPGQFNQQHVRLAMAIAEQVAVAIENARLYARVQTTAALEERQRLARELHDSVSQALYGIGLGARTAKAVIERDPERAKEPIDYVLSLAEAGLSEMRALIFELRPESLETEGLVAALEKQIAATSARYGLRVDAHLDGEPEVPLETKEAIYRIAQEALHNTVKHAHATSVELRLATEDGRVQLDIRDDGRGFDPEGDFPGHLGLKSMRERIARLRGTLEIRSAPGAGTHICARIPLPAAAR